MDTTRLSRSSSPSLQLLKSSSVSESSMVEISEAEHDASHRDRRGVCRSIQTNQTQFIIPDRRQLARDLRVDGGCTQAPGIAESEFRQLARAMGVPDTLCEELIADVKETVATLAKLSPEDSALIERTKAEMKDFARLPVDRSCSRQAATVAAAGASAYLSSFFFGKLALNLSSAAIGSPHGSWIFLLAGLLNPTVSEPLVQGIRATGAAYGSPDGKAMSECWSARLWCERAQAGGDATAYRHHRKTIADHVTRIIEREQSYGIKHLGSGIAEIRYDPQTLEPVEAKTVDGHAVDPAQAEQQVLRWARVRAFITDDLPFLSFTANYTISGALSVLLRPALPPWVYCWTDMAISAGLGTAAGIETATLQNLLRRYVQGATLQAEPVEVKRARLASVGASMSAHQSRMGRLKQVILLLEDARNRLEQQRANGLPVEQQLAELDTGLDDARRAHAGLMRCYEREKRRFDQHSSTLGRAGQSIQSSMAAYLGETGLRTADDVSQGARIRAWSKPAGYMMSLVPVIAYSSYFAPWLVQQLHPTVAGNATGTDYLPDPGASASSPDDGWTKTHTQMALAVANGVPLILGYMLRNQVFAQQIESAMVKIGSWWRGSAVAGSTETQDDESMIWGSDSSSEDDRQGDPVEVRVDGSPDDSSDDE